MNNIIDSETYNMINENHCDNWLEHLDEANESVFEENKDLIPMGLEKKISLYFFQHFFNWKDMDKYSPIYNQTANAFVGNWLDVPFPYADTIILDECATKSLKDDCYNWYELFLILDEMVWENGRVLDIGITSITFDSKIISVYTSS